MARRTIARAAPIGLAALFLCAPTHALLFRAYVASTGNDANPCTLAAPCRLLPAALAAVSSGGEIWMLDSGNYNTGPVAIGKSVTILAVPGALGSVVANGGNAIDIVAAGAEVALRNVVIVPLPGGGGANGVAMASGLSLTVENCLFANLPQAGISVTTSAEVRIANTTLRDNGGAGIEIANGARASLGRATVSGNAGAGVLVRGSSPGTTTVAEIGDSTLDGNLHGAHAWSQHASAAIKVSLHDSRSVRNSGHGALAQSDAGGSALLSLTNNLFSNNGSGAAALAEGSKVWAARNTVSDNSGPGFANTLGVFESVGNNALRNNGTETLGAITDLSVKTLTLGLRGGAPGMVTSSPPGIDCAPACAAAYPSGTMVTLTATAMPNATFTGWGGACSGGGECVVTMDAAKSVLAGFAPTFCGPDCFLSPYAANGTLPPAPSSGKRALATTVQKTDVALVVDTTGSMGGEITNLKNSLSTVIIPGLQAALPGTSIGIGVAGHDDFPYSTFGSLGDLPFYLGNVVSTIPVTAQAGVNSLTLHGGNDLAEAQMPAIFHALTGSGLSWPGGSVAPVFPPPGTFGALHFRSDAFPIVVAITDVAAHNGKRALDTSGTAYDGTLQNPYSFSTFNSDDVLAQLNDAGARFIGVSTDGVRGLGVNDAYGYLAYLADKTGSGVPAASLPPAAGCAAGQCCTGIDGAGVAPDGPGGLCRPVFTVATTGAGLGTPLVNGVAAVLSSAKLDVYVQAYNHPAESIDVVNSFIQRIEPDISGGADAANGQTCLAFSPDQLGDRFSGPGALLPFPDGALDTITQATPGPRYCFNVIPKPNASVAPGAFPQTFRARLRMLAIKPGGALPLGFVDREIQFVVPAVVN